MKARLLLALSVPMMFMFLFGQRVVAQTKEIDAEIEQLRTDLKADREAIIKEALQLTPATADSFWPVYKQYEQEMSGINDNLVKVVKTYAEKFGSINDGDAQDLSMKSFAIQEEKIELKKRYFPIFAKATSPLTAAKFFQADYRLELTFNIKLASELPALFIQSTPVTGTAKGN